jgi:hypothetical protein
VKLSVSSSASTWRRSVEGRTRLIFASAPSTASGEPSAPEPRVASRPEHDDDRLLVAEHQRRQPVARPDPVAPADAALALDRDPELLQHADVAPRRARVDPSRSAISRPVVSGLVCSSSSSSSRREVGEAMAAVKHG